jgi:hypothetical protein
MNSICIARLLLPAVFAALLLPVAAPAQETPFVPRDEGAADPGWIRFRDRLLTALQQRDRKFVLSVIDRNVRNGLERPRGLEEFRRQWDPEADDGPLWRELARALQLPSAWYRHDQMPRSLCAPYVLPQWPGDIDPHSHGAITVRQTEVRSEPSGDAGIRARLGHVIVGVADWEVADRDPASRQKWVLIRLRDGSAGYVPEEHIRSPIEQLACFRRTEAGWRLTSFLAAGE